jgi:hypothetical protein
MDRGADVAALTRRYAATAGRPTGPQLTFALTLSFVTAPSRKGHAWRLVVLAVALIIGLDAAVMTAMVAFL